MSVGGRIVPGWWMVVCSGYLASLSRRRCRPRTLIAYRNELDDLGAFLLEERLQSLPELLRSHLERWQDDLAIRKAPATQGVAATALRGLLKWAAAEELPLSSPTLWMRVVNPRIPPPLPRPLPMHDFLTLRDALTSPEPRNLWRLRTRALFWLTYSSGGRISEVLSLMRDSFDGDTAAVVQKGGRMHTFVIGQRAREAVEDYVEMRRDRLPNLFVSTVEDKPLTKREVQEGWDLLAEALGIPRWTTHQLRHTCATAILRETGDVMLAAKHLGHRSLKAIQGYAEVGMDKRRQAVAILDGAAAG